MRVVITGADGRIGCVLKDHWRKTYDIVAIGNDHDLRERGAWEGLLADAGAIVHLAAILRGADDVETLQRNVAMTVNVVRAAGSARRIIYASSVWAMHRQASIGPRGNYYAASKLAGEAIIGGWSDVRRRPAVSLRIGKFGNPDVIEHEMLRVDEATLLWWFDKAILHQEPAHAVWLAVGRTNHLTGYRAPRVLEGKSST